MGESQNRIFYNILERIGSNGKYQTFCLIMWVVYFMIDGSTAYINVFLFTQNDYVCPDSIQNCKQFVCALPSEQRQKYISQSFYPMASSYQDYRCDTTQLQKMLTFIYFGGMIGTIVGSKVNQHFSKKKILAFSCLVSMIGVSLPLFANSLFLSAVGLSMNYGATWVQGQLVGAIMAETLGQQALGKQTTITYIGFSIGATLNGLIFLGLKDWRLVLIVYQLLPFFLLLLGLIFFVEETPFDSIVNYAPEESFRSLVRIAKMNGKQQHGITEEQIAGIKEAYLANLQKRNTQTISVIDLFRFDSLRILAIICILLRFLMSYQTNMPQLAVSEYSLDMVWSGVVIGSCGIFSYIVQYFTIDRFERRKAVLFLQFISFLVSIIILLFASCSVSVAKCGILSTIIQTSGLFIYKFCINIAYGYAIMATYQMFPTQIRSIALQVTALLSAIAILISPVVQKFCEDKNISIITTYCLCSVLTILVTIKMPETYQISPPDIIKELEYKKQQPHVQ